MVAWQWKDDLSKCRQANLDTMVMTMMTVTVMMTIVIVMLPA